MRVLLFVFLPGDSGRITCPYGVSGSLCKRGMQSTWQGPARALSCRAENSHNVRLTFFKGAAQWRQVRS